MSMFYFGKQTSSGRQFNCIFQVYITSVVRKQQKDAESYTVSSDSDEHISEPSTSKMLVIIVGKNNMYIFIKKKKCFITSTK